MYTNFSTKSELFLACFDFVRWHLLLGVPGSPETDHSMEGGSDGPGGECPATPETDRSVAWKLQVERLAERHRILHEIPSGLTAQFIFQTVSSIHDPDLEDRAPVRIRELEGALGVVAFQELLLIGAHELLGD